MMAMLRSLALSLVLIAGASMVPPAQAAETGPTWLNAPGELHFNRGGVRGRYLIFEDWNATRDWTINAVVRHDGALWVAFSDPPVGAIPGVAAPWEKITDQAVSGSVLRYRGEHDTSVTDYTLGDVVHVGSSGLRVYWIVGDPSVANDNVPNLTQAAEDSGWELLTESSHYRGDAEIVSEYYHAGDTVHIAGTQDVYLALVAGDFTAAQIQTSDDWRNITRGIPVLDDATFNAGPTAANAAASQIVQHEGRLWVAEVDPSSTGRSVSFRAYTNANYRGVVYNEPPSPQVDDFWFSTSTHQWRIQDTGGVVRRLHTQNAHFIDGDYPTRAEAEAAVGEADDVIVYPNGQGVFVAHQVQAFTPGTTQYRYAPLDSRVAADAPLEIDNDTGHIRLGNVPFTRLSDTPANYTGAARYEVRVNEAGTGLVFLDETGIASALPVVDRLPDATLSGAHEVVFLTHDYTEGVRQDATVVVASPFLGDSGLVGYASSATGDRAGSTTFFSPMDELYGVGTTSNFGLDTVATLTNPIWMNNANRIVLNNTDYFLGESFVYRGRTVRRILSAPSGISNASVSVNFRRPDDSYYFTDGSSVRHLSGLYERREGAYHKLISRGLIHIDGVGAPDEAPTEVAQGYVDDLGRLWIAGDRLVEAREPHALADEQFDHAFLAQAPESFGPLLAIGDGAFALQGTTDEFAQIRGDSLNDLATGLSWQDVWAYLFSEDLDTSDQVRNLRDNSVWLGRFPSRTEMTEELVEAIGTGSFTANTYYFAITSDRIIRVITSFTEGNVTHEDELFWNGPFATESDAVSIVENYIVEYGGHGRPNFAADSGGQLAINDSGDIYVSASEIVDHSTNPVWQQTVRTVPEATGTWPYWRGAEPREDVSDLTADGYFNYAAAEHQWYVEYANGDHEGDWASVVELFRTQAGLATIRNNAPSGLLPGIAGEASVFLAGPDTAFANDAEAAIFVSTQGITNPGVKPFVWFTGDAGNPFGWQLRVVDAGGYRAGVVQRHEVFHWLGPINASALADTTAYYPIGTGRVGGTGDAITLTTGQSLAAVPHGAMFIFEATAENTGATTVAVDGTAAIRVERSNGAGGSTPLTGGEITVSDVIILVYEANFGLFHWIPGHMGLLARENEVGNDELSAALRDEIAQGGRPIAGLRYVISEAATTPDAPSNRWNGNIYQAHRDMTVRGFSYYRGAVNELSIPYAGTCFPVTRASATDYRTSTVPLWNIRLAPDGSWQTNQAVIPDNQFSELELRAPGDGFHVDRDDYFACMAFFRLIAGQTGISTGIVGATGSTERDHADHSFTDNLMSYVARASINRADRFFSNQNIFNNTTHSIRMEIHYDALPTQFRDGVVDAARCSGDNLILERSEGLSDLTVNEACQGSSSSALNIGALTNLASGDIEDTDEFVLYDGDADANVSITQGELAARLADGTTITSSGGTLTAVGGGAADGTVDTAALAATTGGDIALTLGRTIGADVDALLDIDGTPPSEHPRIAWDPVNNRLRWDRERLLLLAQRGQIPFQANQINLGFEADNGFNILGGNPQAIPGQQRATITIPQPPVQSNYGETDSTALSFIQNKPPLGTAAVLDSGEDAGDVPLLEGAGVLSINVIPGTLSPLVDLQNRPNLASGDIADTDRFLLYDGSADANVSITQGELAARLADGTTITSSGGTLTAVGGGSGGGGAFSGALVDRSADLSVNGALGAVSWNTEEFDDGDWHSTANGTRLTVPADVSHVRVGCSLRYENVGNGNQVLAQIRLNGSHAVGLPQQTALVATPATSADVSVTSAVIEVDENDYFECFKQSNDNTITIATESWFGIVSEPGGSGSGGAFDGNLAGDLSVGGTATVTGDIHAEADIHLDDNEHLVFGADTDVSIDYDASETDLEIRIGPDPDRIVVYDGTGTAAQHALEKDGDASHAGDLTVSGGLTVTGQATVSGIAVAGDLDAQNDIHLGDRDQLILGTDLDATFDFDDRTSEVEIRLGPSATAFSVYDGTGTDRRFRFSRDGTSTLGGNVTVQGNLLPNTDGGNAVGTAARAWGNGEFDALTVNGRAVNPSVDVLVDTLETAGVTITPQGWQDADQRFDLGRALIDADKARMMSIIMEYTSTSGGVSHPDYTCASTFPSEAFIDLPSIVRPSNNSLPVRTLVEYCRRMGSQTLAGFAEVAVHIARERDAGGNDFLVFAFGVANGAQNIPVEEFKTKIALH